ncbi:MAG: cation:proton antiporter [Actinomycetota bacterium]|nr:cation:proton antiporter [Actinomycetota bacterium]
MGHQEVAFLPLLIVIALAFVVPILLSRVQRFVFIPVVVGELVAGMIVGESGLGIVQDNEVLSILSVLGFAFLMFLSGLEIDLGGFAGGGEDETTGIRRVIESPLGMGVALLVLTLGASVGVGFLVAAQGLVENPWIMALILSTTSLGVVMPVLKEQGLTGGRYGQTIIVSAMVADFSTIVLISSYAIFYRQGLSLDLMLVLVLIAAFLVVYRVAMAFRSHPPAERLFEQLSSATAQLGLRGSLTLAFLFIALAEGLGIEYILGAFLAGVIVSSLSGGKVTVLQDRLDAFGYGFFIPIFFVMVGVGFDLPALLGSREALILVPLLIAMAYAVKLVPILVLRLRFTWRETIAAGMLVSSRLSLIVAAAAIGLELGVITDAVNSAIILIAIITCTVSPVAFSWLMPDRVERDRIIVVGSRSSAGLLADRLREHEFETVLISEDATPEDTDRGFSEMLGDAGADRAHTVVTMRHSDRENLEVCRAARQDHGVENVISWVQNPALNGAFREVGARVTNPAYSAVLSIESMVLSPGTFSLTADVDETREVREVYIRRRELHGRPLSKLDLPGETIVLMIERDGGVIVPDHVVGNEVVLQRHDVVMLAGNAGEVDEAVRSLR